MASSGMWHRLDLVWTDVSEERIAFFFRVEISASEEQAWASGCRLQPPAHAVSSHADISTLTMKAIRSSETSVQTRSTQSHIPEDGILHSHRRENLKSYICVYSYRVTISVHVKSLLSFKINFDSFIFMYKYSDVSCLPDSQQITENV
jgi:hypothetical protein